MSKPVYSNYEDAVDTDISKIKSKAVKIADTLSSLIAGDKKIIPTGLSNCTLTATQWVNPKVPINRAQTIIDKGKKYGYVEIPESHAQEGDLIIATNPNDNSHHTMLLTGFNNGQTTHQFQGNNYLLPNDHPLVTYSNGLTTKAGLRTNLGLKEYLDNSDGKSQLQYFRYIKPGTNEVLLPEITVTPNGNYVKEGQKTIYINRK